MPYANDTERLAYQREYARQFRETNPEEAHARVNASNMKNHIKRNRQEALRYQANKEVKKAQARARYQMKKASMNDN